MGIGAGFVPGVLDVKSIDEIIPGGARRSPSRWRGAYGREEGIPGGISSGAAAMPPSRWRRARRARASSSWPWSAHTGERYLSTPLFQFDE